MILEDKRCHVGGGLRGAAALAGVPLWNSLNRTSADPFGAADAITFIRDSKKGRRGELYLGGGLDIHNGISKDT